jgi:hypothetical protein
MKRPYGTVTADGWSTSSTSCLPERTTLNVSRQRGGRTVPGDADGLVFPTADAAWDYAYEHGYIVQHRKGWCPRCRRQHWWCGARTGECAAARGNGYPGCEEAQVQFDASDRTWRDRRRRARVAARAAAFIDGVSMPDDPDDAELHKAARKMWT